MNDNNSFFYTIFTYSNLLSLKIFVYFFGLFCIIYYYFVVGNFNAI